MENYRDYIVNAPADTPFNEVDSLVCTQLIYNNFDGIVPSFPDCITLQEASEQYVMKHGALPDMLNQLGSSKRFGSVKLSDYDHVFDASSKTQYSAVTCHLWDGSLYVTFVGADDTFVGWQDAFRMSYEITPAETRSLHYLHQIAMQYPNVPMYVGGHSKGGALAVYASMLQSSEVRNRIRRIYSFDGPGLSEEAYDADRFDSIRTRLIQYRPQFSVVGFLYDRKDPYRLVYSNGTRYLQHDPITWAIEGNSIKPTLHRDPESVYISSVFNHWIRSTTRIQRMTFVPEFFSSLASGGAETFTDISSNQLHHYASLLSSLAKSNQKTKQAILKFETSIFKALPDYDTAALIKKTAPLWGTSAGIILLFTMLNSSPREDHSNPPT